MLAGQEEVNVPVTNRLRGKAVKVPFSNQARWYLHQQLREPLRREIHDHLYFQIWVQVSADLDAKGDGR